MQRLDLAPVQWICKHGASNNKGWLELQARVAEAREAWNRIGLEFSRDGYHPARWRTDDQVLEHGDLSSAAVAARSR